MPGRQFSGQLPLLDRPACAGCLRRALQYISDCCPAKRAALAPFGGGPVLQEAEEGVEGRVLDAEVEIPAGIFVLLVDAGTGEGKHLAQPEARCRARKGMLREAA